MSTTVTPPADFDALTYIKQANETQAAVRAGKPVTPPVADKSADAASSASAKAAPVEEPKLEQHVSRSDRRRMNNLIREAAEAKGRADAMEAMLAKSGVPGHKAEPPAAKTEDPEPQRTQFGTDAEYNRALGRWDARQEAKSLIAKKDQRSAGEQAQVALQQQSDAAKAKFTEDVKLIPDWDKIAKAAEDDDEQPEYIPAEHPGLMTLIAISESQAFVLAYLAQHPKEMQKLLDLTKSPGEQIKYFGRVEARAEAAFVKPDEKKPDEKKPSVAERDAAKPKPSESVSARGGTAAPDKLEMFITVNGKNQLNPAWKAQRNEAEGRRP